MNIFSPGYSTVFASSHPIVSTYKVPCRHRKSDYIINVYISFISKTTTFTFTECDYALGMENGMIQDYQISASAYSTATGSVGSKPPYMARFNLNTAAGYEKPYWQDPSPTNNWITVDLLATHEITKLMIQGAPTANDYIKSFSLTFSQDGLTWQDYLDTSGNIQVSLLNIWCLYRSAQMKLVFVYFYGFWFLRLALAFFALIVSVGCFILEFAFLLC